MLKLIKWGVENGPIKKKGVWVVNTFFKKKTTTAISC